MLRAREAPAITTLKGIVPRSWHKPLHLGDSATRAMRLNSIGANGLAALGTNAAPAIPILLDLIETPLPGPDSVHLTVWTLKFLGPEAEPAVPTLSKLLKHKDSSVRSEAAMTLGYIHGRPEVVVPALASFLEWRKQQNGNSESCSAIQSLMMIGTNASAATPIILDLLNDPDQRIREAASNCLPRIDPAAAKRVGVGQH